MTFRVTKVDCKRGVVTCENFIGPIRETKKRDHGVVESPDPLRFSVGDSWEGVPDASGKITWRKKK